MKGFERRGEVKTESGPASCGRWNGRVLPPRPLPQKRLYLHVVPAEALQDAPAEASWSVLFAFHATAARSVGEPNRAQASTRLEAFHGHVLNWLGNLDGGHTLSLRFLCDPDQGRLDLALLGKVVGPDREAARRKAGRFAGELEQLLQLDPYHRLRAVTDSGELEGLLRPFSPKAVVEVQRTGMSLEIGLGRTLWVVKPFPGQSSTPTLETFLQMMLAQPGSTLLDICFSRRHHELQVQEIRRQASSYLQELSTVREYRPSGAGFLGDLKRRASLPDLPQELLEPCLRYLIGQLEELEARKGLWVKIRLAGEGERVSSPLVQAWIADFAGGGSWWESVSRTERTPQAEASLASLEAEASPLLDSSALLGNLHAFYDLPQALLLFRLPLPTP